MSLLTQIESDWGDILAEDVDFSEAIVVDGTTVYGVWEGDSNEGGGRHGPVFICLNSALPAGVDRDSTITKGGTSYRLESFEHDGLGMTLLVLRET